VPPEFHFVDEDPADPASGADCIIINRNGTITHA
jgi:hypothetical protein